MSDEPLHLDAVQQWLQAVITHPHGIAPGLASDQAVDALGGVGREAGRIVTRSSDLTAEERLAIYGRAYYARLLECFRAEYPCLLFALGEAAFHQFVLEYLQQHPSHGYTLRELSAAFPAYLDSNRPGPESSMGDEFWPDFIIDLAHLERLFSTVYDGPGSEKNKPPALQPSPISLHELLRRGLEPAISLRLVTYDFPVDAYFRSVRLGEEPALPFPEATWLALVRNNYRVHIHRLTYPQFEFLQSVLRGNRTIAAFGGLPDGQVGWLRSWIQAGFFTE